MTTFQLRTASVDGHRIVYDVTAVGPALVLVPARDEYRGGGISGGT